MAEPGFPTNTPANFEADFSSLTARAVAVINALIASGDFIPAHTPDETSIASVVDEQVKIGFPSAQIVFNEANGNGETIIGGYNGNETEIIINDAAGTVGVQGSGAFSFNGDPVVTSPFSGVFQADRITATSGGGTGNRFYGYFGNFTPTTTELPATGDWGFAAPGGVIKIYFNFGGVIKTSAAFT